MKLPLLLAPLLLLAACAGYHLGSAKPAALTHVKTIAVPMFANDTLHPKAETLATSAVANAFTNDGTYRIADSSQADAILEGSIKTISYDPLRGSRLNTLHPEELLTTITLEWTLKDAKNPIKILAKGSSSGSSQLFVDSNLQTARNNALPNAFERAGEALVSRLTTGF